VSTQGLEQGTVERGFQFAGEPIAIDQTPVGPDVLFDVADEARLYTKVHADLGMIADPDQAGEVIKASMQTLHNHLIGDRKPEDPEVFPFFAVDLADREGVFEETETAFNNQIPGIPELYIYRPLYENMTVEQLNRRSFAGEAAVTGWDARAMILGGEREDAPGLLFTNMSAAEQIEAFKALRAEYEADRPVSNLALMNFLDHLVVNAAIREKNEHSRHLQPLLDQHTFSRTPQAGDPETGLVEDADPYDGLRVSAGPKPVEA